MRVLLVSANRERLPSPVVPLGVLSVGTISILRPDDFPRATVWSGFGQGYGYVPLLLPILGLIWLWRTRPAG